MINIKHVKQYCKDYTEIENYDLAVKDENQVWHCHHRFETETSDGEIRPRKAQLKKAELIELCMYYDRPATELIFLTKKEHEKIHRTFDCDEDWGSEKEDKKAYDKAKGRAYKKAHKEERNRADKVRYFIRAHGSVPISDLPKKWTEEDIKYYLLRTAPTK